MKIDVILNGLEKHMTFMINKSLVCLGSMKFMDSSFEKLVKKLADNGFKYLTQEFGSKKFRALKTKRRLCI